MSLDDGNLETQLIQDPLITLGTTSNFLDNVFTNEINIGKFSIFVDQDQLKRKNTITNEINELSENLISLELRNYKNSNFNKLPLFTDSDTVHLIDLTNDFFLPSSNKIPSQFSVYSIINQTSNYFQFKYDYLESNFNWIERFQSINLEYLEERSNFLDLGFKRLTVSSNIIYDTSIQLDQGYEFLLVFSNQIYNDIGELDQSLFARRSELAVIAGDITEISDKLLNFDRYLDSITETRLIIENFQGISNLDELSEEQENYLLSNVKIQIANTLNIGVNVLNDLRLEAGSVIVAFDIDSTNLEGANTTQELASKIQNLMDDSSFKSSEIGRSITEIRKTDLPKIINEKDLKKHSNHIFKLINNNTIYFNSTFDIISSDINIINSNIIHTNYKIDYLNTNNKSIFSNINSNINLFYQHNNQINLNKLDKSQFYQYSNQINLNKLDKSQFYQYSNETILNINLNSNLFYQHNNDIVLAMTQIIDDIDFNKLDKSLFNQYSNQVNLNKSLFNQYSNQTNLNKLDKSQFNEYSNQINLNINLNSNLFYKHNNDIILAMTQIIDDIDFNKLDKSLFNQYSNQVNLNKSLFNQYSNQTNLNKLDKSQFNEYSNETNLKINLNSNLFYEHNNDIVFAITQTIDERFNILDENKLDKSLFYNINFSEEFEKIESNVSIKNLSITNDMLQGNISHDKLNLNYTTKTYVDSLINNYYNKNYIDSNILLKSDLSLYSKTTDINIKINKIKDNINSSNYVSIPYLNEKLEQDLNLSNYVSIPYLNEKLEDLEIGDIDLSEYSKTTDINIKINKIKDNINSSNYVSIPYLNEKLEQDLNLSNYVSIPYLNEKLEDLEIGDIDLSEYSKTTDINIKINKIKDNINSSNYVSISYLNEKLEDLTIGDIDLSEYSKTTDINIKINKIKDNINSSNYVSIPYLNEKLEQDLNLSNYVSIPYLNEKLEDLTIGDIDLSEYSKTTDINIKINKIKDNINSSNYVSIPYLNKKLEQDLNLSNYVSIPYLNDKLDDLAIGDIDLSKYSKTTDINIKFNQIEDDIGDISRHFILTTSKFNEELNNINIDNLLNLSNILINKIYELNSNLLNIENINLNDYLTINNFNISSNILKTSINKIENRIENNLLNYSTLSNLNNLSNIFNYKLNNLNILDDIDLSNYINNNDLQNLSNSLINKINNIDLFDYIKSSNLNIIIDKIYDNILNNSNQLDNKIHILNDKINLNINILNSKIDSNVNILDTKINENQNIFDNKFNILNEHINYNSNQFNNKNYIYTTSFLDNDFEFNNSKIEINKNNYYTKDNINTIIGNFEDNSIKEYIDGISLGLDIKKPAKYATTTNINLQGLLIIDNFQIEIDNRILVKNQNDKRQNGIYLSKSESWIRTSDFNNSDNIKTGSFIFIENGLNNENSSWVLSTNGIINIGQNNIEFIKFNTPGNLNAINGLKKVGNDIMIDKISNDMLEIINTPNKIFGNSIQLKENNVIKNDNGLYIDIDNLSIENKNNKLSIKENGITNNMLNGNISNDKLDIINTPNKIIDKSISLSFNDTFDNSNGLKIKNKGITNDMLNGNIDDNKLNTIITPNKIFGSSIQLLSNNALENSNGLKIKNKGITNDMLNGNIDDNKLNTIITPNKIFGSSIQLLSNNALENSNGLKIKNKGITNDMLNGNITYNKLNISDIDFKNDNGTIFINSNTFYNIPKINNLLDQHDNENNNKFNKIENDIDYLLSEDKLLWNNIQDKEQIYYKGDIVIDNDIILTGNLEENYLTSNINIDYNSITNLAVGYGKRNTSFNNSLKTINNRKDLFSSKSILIDGNIYINSNVSINYNSNVQIIKYKEQNDKIEDIILGNIDWSNINSNVLYTNKKLWIYGNLIASGKIYNNYKTPDNLLLKVPNIDITNIEEVNIKNKVKINNDKIILKNNSLEIENIDTFFNTKNIYFDGEVNFHNKHIHTLKEIYEHSVVYNASELMQKRTAFTGQIPITYGSKHSVGYNIIWTSNPTVYDIFKISGDIFLADTNKTNGFRIISSFILTINPIDDGNKYPGLDVMLDSQDSYNLGFLKKIIEVSVERISSKHIKLSMNWETHNNYKELYYANFDIVAVVPTKLGKRMLFTPYHDIYNNDKIISSPYHLENPFVIKDLIEDDDITTSNLYYQNIDIANLKIIGKAGVNDRSSLIVYKNSIENNINVAEFWDKHSYDINTDKCHQCFESHYYPYSEGVVISKSGITSIGISELTKEFSTITGHPNSNLAQLNVLTRDNKRNRIKISGKKNNRISVFDNNANLIIGNELKFNSRNNIINPFIHDYALDVNGHTYLNGTFSIENNNIIKSFFTVKNILDYSAKINDLEFYITWNINEKDSCNLYQFIELDISYYIHSLENTNVKTGINKFSLLINTLNDTINKPNMETFAEYVSQKSLGFIPPNITSIRDDYNSVKINIISQYDITPDKDSYKTSAYANITAVGDSIFNQFIISNKLDYFGIIDLPSVNSNIDLILTSGIYEIDLYSIFNITETFRASFQVIDKIIINDIHFNGNNSNINTYFEDDKLKIKTYSRGFNYNFKIKVLNRRNKIIDIPLNYNIIEIPSIKPIINIHTIPDNQPIIDNKLDFIYQYYDLSTFDQNIYNWDLIKFKIKFNSRFTIDSDTGIINIIGYHTGLHQNLNIETYYLNNEQNSYILIDNTFTIKYREINKIKLKSQYINLPFITIPFMARTSYTIDNIFDYYENNYDFNKIKLKCITLDNDGNDIISIINNQIIFEERHMFSKINKFINIQAHYFDEYNNIITSTINLSLKFKIDRFST